ncbi:MAG: AAA family ATPase [Oscillospiraceae bacterium]|nr:AAA family ATPase [Oscillospiraceae bacterium]
MSGSKLQASEQVRSIFILDPLQAYLGGADMHSANGVRPLMKRLAAVAESTGAAIVLIGHLNKRGGSKSVHRGSACTWGCFSKRCFSKRRGDGAVTGYDEAGEG